MMRELMRTNDIVVLSYVRSLFEDQAINSVVLDQNMSVMEGSIGILPSRVMVSEDDFARAKRILTEADLAKWIKDP